MAGLERHVGEHHPEGGAGPHPFDGGQEPTRPADRMELGRLPLSADGSVTATSVPRRAKGPEYG